MDFGSWILDFEFLDKIGCYIRYVKYWARRPGSADFNNIHHKCK